MKLLLFLTIYICCPQRYGDSFFDLSFTSIDGSQVSMSSLKGKKIVILPFNGNTPDIKVLQYMDSLTGVNNDSLVTIAFPALDFDSTVNVSSLLVIRDSSFPHLLLSQPGWVQKSGSHVQMNTFQWLTSMERNGHFDRDVEEEGQLFVISREGMLYSVLGKNTYKASFIDVFRTKVREQ